jgi:hypothetical protein
MSPSAGKPLVAIIDSKNLRRASITSLLEPWANSENLRLTSFAPDQAPEALQAEPDFRMLIFSIGGESVAEEKTLKHLKVCMHSQPMRLWLSSPTEKTLETSPLQSAFKRKASSIAGSPPRSHTMHYLSS